MRVLKAYKEEGIIIVIMLFLLCQEIDAQTWQKIEMNFPQSDTLLERSYIAFATKNVGWIVTSGSVDTNMPPNKYSTKIFKTTDGGHNWKLQYIDSTFRAGSIFTIDSLSFCHARGF